MLTDGSYISGEDNIIYKLTESLCSTAETNVMLCVNYIQILKKKTNPPQKTL